MRKNLFIFALAWLVSACTQIGNPVEQNYTVPSWTLYKRAVQSGKSVEEAKVVLVSKNYPYNINVTVNGDPSVQMGVAWFTNTGVNGGILQLVEGKADDDAAFSRAREFPAVSVAVDSINYVSAGNGKRNKNEGLIAVTGFLMGEKRSYTSNKVLADNLKPNTLYAYRIGSKNAWSETGRFTTAPAGKETFEFIYVTDTQANTDEMFDVSKKTIEAAHQNSPDAKFLLINGDMVESSNAQSSEWEWEQWFEKMQKVWLCLPIVPTQGNHDTSPFGNMFHHFNTDDSFNRQQADEAKTTMDGTVYSFAYGDALFMIINYEDYDRGEPYFLALERWMHRQVTGHPGLKWKIAAFHKAMFTGSDAHQTEKGEKQDGKIVRERFAGVFQRLNIDLALQGHDHIYEVIGVVAADGTNYTRLADAVSNQRSVTPTPADGKTPSVSVTGKEGGTFNVSNGIIYFLNSSAGVKKYYPRSKEQMETAFDRHGVKDYFDLFNKFGQPGTPDDPKPTFSRIRVSTDTIDVSTYTVDNRGTVELFDVFKIVK